MKQPSHILHTGLIDCFDRSGNKIPCTGSGQDGEYRLGCKAGSDRFAVQGEVVHDTLTELSWPRRADIFTFPLPWQDTLDAITDLNQKAFLGFTDWRLPNRRELRSIISHGARKPSLPPGHPFRQVFLGWYWTSTTSARATAYAWYVHFEGGRMFYGHKEQPCMAWPVRGESSILPRTGQHTCFTVSGDPTDCGGTRQDGELQTGAAWPEPRFEGHELGVLDRLTGLVWARKADLTGLCDWQDALDSVAALNRTARVTWRLPDINELESLVDASRSDPALPGGHPFEQPGEAYWSSTTSFFETDWAYCLYLHKGAVGVGYKGKAVFQSWPVTGPL
jgi:hypothetical protein